MSFCTERRPRGTVPFAIVLLLTMSATLFLLPDGADATTLYVGQNSTYSTIQSAIDNALTGDRIVIGKGNYNESLFVPQSAITLSGNDSAVLNGISGTSMILRNSNVTIEGLEVRNGTIDISGDNIVLRDLDVSAKTTVGIRAKDVFKLTLLRTNIIDPVNTGIWAYNVTYLSASAVVSKGMNATLMHLDRCNRVSLADIDMDLWSGITGIEVLNSTEVTVTDPVLSSTFGANTAFAIKDTRSVAISCTTTKKFTGTQYSFLSCSDIDIEGDLFGYGTSGTGFFFFDSLNITVGLHSACLCSNWTGIHAERSVNITIVFFDDHEDSIFLYDDTTFVHLMLCDLVRVGGNHFNLSGENATGVKAFTSSDLNITGNIVQVHSTDSTFADLTDCRFSNITGNLLNVRSSSSNGIRANDSSDLFIFHNWFNVIGDDAVGISAVGTRDIDLVYNSFMVKGASSSGAELVNCNLNTSMNTFTVNGTYSCGLSGEWVRYNSTCDRFFVEGMLAKGMDFLEISSLNISGALFHSSGQGARAFVSTGHTRELRMDHITVEGGPESGSSISIIDNSGDDPAIISDCDLSSDSNQPVIDISFELAELNDSAIFKIMGSKITSMGTGISMKATPGSIFFGALEMDGIDISAPKALHLNRTWAKIYYSNLSSPCISIEAEDHTKAETIDSSVGGMLVDDSSEIRVRYSLWVRIEDRFGYPIPDVELLVSSDENIYATPYFDPDSTSPRTDANGTISRVTAIHLFYMGIPTPTVVKTSITVHLEGNADVWMDVYFVEVTGPTLKVLVCPDIDMPSVPRNFSARPLDTREGLFLNWTVNQDDTIEYHIYRFDEPTVKWNLVASVPNPQASYSTEDLGERVRGLFFVKAFDGTWESKASSIGVATTKDMTGPSYPTDLHVEGKTKTSLTIGWSHPGSDDLIGFSLLYAVDGEDPSEAAWTGAENRTATINGLSPGTVLDIWVVAYDESGNPSERSPTLQASTLLMNYGFAVLVLYEEEGPLQGDPAENATVHLISFNGTVVSTSFTDVNGRASFDGLEPDEPYLILASPDPSVMGEAQIKSGYMPFGTSYLTINGSEPVRSIEIVLPYTVRTLFGSVSLQVRYGEGTRSGPVYKAKITLVDDHNIEIMNGTTDADGKFTAGLLDLPLRGRFNIEPPLDVVGDPDAGRSGYIGRTTNFFDISWEDPDFGLMEEYLAYYEHIVPPEPLMVLEASPRGRSVTLDIPVTIRFNQPVDTESVEEGLKFTPDLKGRSFAWSDDNTTLTVAHDDFLQGEVYRVTVGHGAVSAAGTTFEANYTGNTWEFTTTELPGGEDNGPPISKTVMWVLVLVMLVLVIMVVAYLWSVSRGRREKGGDDAFFELEGAEEDEDYPDDLVDGMVDDMPIGYDTMEEG